MPALVRLLFVPLVLCATMARAGDIPDLRGTWHTVAHEGITTGSRHFPQADATPRFVTGKFTMEITDQQGRRFLGVKRSERSEEKIMGVIGYDGATVHILEDEGTFHGRLLPDGTLELIYSHDAGASKGIGIALYARDKK